MRKKVPAIARQRAGKTVREGNIKSISKTHINPKKNKSSSSREITITGLHSNVRIYGRIKAIGRKGQEANSEILSRIVQ